MTQSFWFNPGKTAQQCAYFSVSVHELFKIRYLTNFQSHKSVDLAKILQGPIISVDLLENEVSISCVSKVQ